MPLLSVYCARVAFVISVSFALLNHSARDTFCAGKVNRESTLSDMFTAYLLGRNIRYEADLVDQLFSSSEKRLARILLLLAHFGKEGVPETVVPKIGQETLAEMIGTTRSRVSFFMNRFRKLGFIDYQAGDALQVHSSLLNIVLHD